jgi:hypothetical protein
VEFKYVEITLVAMGVDCIVDRKEIIDSRHSEVGAQHLILQTADSRQQQREQQTADRRAGGTSTSCDILSEGFGRPMGALYKQAQQ